MLLPVVLPLDDPPPRPPPRDPYPLVAGDEVQGGDAQGGDAGHPGIVVEGLEGGLDGPPLPVKPLEVFSLDSVRRLAHRLDAHEAAYASFSLSVDRAASKLRRWMKSRWFAPSDFKEFDPRSVLLPFFLPFWQFRVKTHTMYSAEVLAQGADAWQQEAGTIVDHFPDILISAAHDVEMLRWQREFGLDVDWQSKRAVRPLAKIEESDISISSLTVPQQWTRIWEQQSKEIKALQEKKVAAQVKREGRKAKGVKSCTTFSDFTRRLIYLPIYIGQYAYEGKQYSVAVHGQSGNVLGERPYGIGFPG